MRGTFSSGKPTYRDVTIQSLQDIIALIRQEAYVFHESLADNLKIGRDIPDKLFDQTLKTSLVDSFARDRLETVFDDNFSGGQRHDFLLHVN